MQEAGMRDGFALQASDVHVRLGERQVLRGVNVRFRQGCWTSVVGPNGAGKSTLLRALAGVVPMQGQVHIGEQLSSAMSAKARARALAWLGQDEMVAAHLSVADVVMLGRLPHQDWTAVPNVADHAAVAWAMQQTQTHDWQHRQVHHLSGGERQRVLLARALATQAPVVLMDEPLANLDLPHQADWVEQTQAYVQAGATVVSVLHEINMALLADDVLVMQNGAIVHQGAAQDSATHQAIEDVFAKRVQIVPMPSTTGVPQWVALVRPCATAHREQP
jgi:iron complex transport system ATP-binding protein